MIRSARDGAGTTNAGVLRGRRTYAANAAADGAKTAADGAGSHCHFKKLDREQLRTGPARFQKPEVVSRAARLGAAIDAAGDGTAIAARALDDWLVTAEPLPTAAPGGASTRPTISV